MAVLTQHDGFPQPYNNFSNRPHPLAQNRGAIPMGTVIWRVTEKANIAFGGGLPDARRAAIEKA